MQAKLYIGSIPGNTTEQELKAHFGSVCQMVSLILVKNKHNNKTNSGFGFLTVASAADVQKLQAMDHVLGGRKIKVEPFAEGNKLKEVRTSLMRKRLYISDIPEQVTDAHIEEFFGKFGPLESAYKVKVQSTKKPCTFGYVTFTTEEPALELIKAGSVVINGFKILVFPYSKRKEQLAMTEQQEQLSPEIGAQPADRQKEHENVSGRGTFGYGSTRHAQQSTAFKTPTSQESQHQGSSKAGKQQKKRTKKNQEVFERAWHEDRSVPALVPPFAEKNIQHLRTISSSASPRTDSHQTSSSGAYLDCSRDEKKQQKPIVEVQPASAPEFDRKGAVSRPLSTCEEQIHAKPTSKLYHQAAAGGLGGRLEHHSDNVCFRHALRVC